MDDAAPQVPTSPKLHPIKAPLIFTAISAVVFIILGVFGVLFLNKQGANLFTSPSTAGFEKFSSESQLRDYLTEAQSAGLTSLGGFSAGLSRDMVGMPLSAPSAFSSLESTGANNVKRVSETNVQVIGLDEPDIVKTDGKNIFFSSENYYLAGGGVGRPMPVEPFIMEDSSARIAPDIYPPQNLSTTKVINAFPPESIALSSKIDTTGDLLLSENVLMVMTYNKVTAFDVANPASPKEIWSHEFDENFSYATARLTGGKVYLVTSRYADYSLPCPVPLLKGVNAMTIPCTDIYRPMRPISSNTVYSVVKLDPKSGSVEDSVTFLGDAGGSVIYMSPNAIYASFVSYPSPLEFLANFLAENRDLFSDEVANKVENLRAIDISNESKINELGIIIQKHLSGLTNDERARVESEFTNKMSDYIKSHGRELQVTSLVKIDKNSLDVSATGEVPGSPLNQFSLDEWSGNLRVTTTLSASTMFGQGESANDLYVLDANLRVIGQIQGLALGERIYSARFIEDKAYLVTFKQIDPFFVIDLSNPSSPRVAGELKIPGFSSYLHPLSENRILGVGQEGLPAQAGSQSKLSVFDVSNPDNPVEVDKYMLNEYYSEVQNNHHAFLADPDHGVFFMPAGANGYILSWTNGLTLERVVTGISARRALYINDFLYVVGDSKIVVLNELTWEETSSLEF